MLVFWPFKDPFDDAVCFCWFYSRCFILRPHFEGFQVIGFVIQPCDVLFVGFWKADPCGWEGCEGLSWGRF